jgi:imidazolonepropionase-like amidohydrolase
MLWSLVTRNAAKALQWPSDIGELADFVVFDVSTEQPLRDILESDQLPREVWIGGVRRIPPASPC